VRSSSDSASRTAYASDVVFIGIAGGSGSGKSTLAGALGAALGPDRCATITFDRYYRDLAGRSAPERASVNFDHPDSLDDALFGEHLDGLRAGNPVDVPVYDFATHSRAATVDRVEPRSVVVVDGILLLAVSHLAERLDHAVFVDVPDSVRLARRIARDRVERGRSEESVRAQFAATVVPMHQRFVQPSAMLAHVRVSGERPFEPVVRDLLGWVEKALRKGTGDL
jgi:uridine kinase